MRNISIKYIFIILVIIIIASNISAQSIISVLPQPHRINVPVDTVIAVQFDADMDSETINENTFIVYSAVSGKRSGSYNYNSGTKTATFTPTVDFIPGEIISTTLTTGIKTTADTPLQVSYNWNFTISVYVGLVDFKEGATTNVGSTPYSLISADFNGDSELDMAVVNLGSNNVSIIINEGHDVYTQTSTITVGAEPNAITSCDFENDGDIDLAITNSGSGTISILINNGNGAFSDNSTITVGGAPNSIIANDLDGDGDIDLAVTRPDSDDVAILKNNGLSVFTLFSHPDVEDNPNCIRTADADSDGDIDLIVSNKNTNRISILTNQGAGNFFQTTTLNAGNAPLSIASGDFNGDKHIDIAVINELSNDVNILTNNGSGFFFPTDTINVGGSPRAIATGDLDGDGDLDLSVVIWGSFTILSNDGNGNFTLKPTTIFVLGYDLTVNDLDNDGDLDLGFVNQLSNSVSIWKNKNATPDISLLTTSHNFGKVKVANTTNFTLKIRNDGTDQILRVTNITSSNTAFTAAPTSGTINAGDTMEVMVTFIPDKGASYNDSLIITSNDRNNPNIPFYMSGIGDPLISTTPASNAIAVSKSSNISVIFTSDLNSASLTSNTIVIKGQQSGFHTIASSYDFGSKTITINPDTDFKPGETVSVTLTEGIKNLDDTPIPCSYNWNFTVASSAASAILSKSSDIAVGQNPKNIITSDFNNDNSLDLAVINSNSNIIKILLNDGLGNYNDTTSISVAVAPYKIIAEDFNNDGNQDIAATANDIYILKNDGNSNFNITTVTTSGDGHNLISTGDFNNDGAVDIIITNTGLDSVSLFNNDGSGNFTSTKNIGITATPSALVSGDFNNDKNLDFAIVYRDAGTVLIFLNSGDGNFTNTSTIAVGNNPRSIAAGDFNSDRNLDLAVANSDGNNISILKNSGDGTFYLSSIIEADDNPRHISSADFDGDGDLDLAAANEQADNILIITNDDGAGSFSTHSTATTGNSPINLIVCDIDNDNDLDIASANNNSHSISILKNRVTAQDIALSTTSIKFDTVKSFKSNNASFKIFNEGGMKDLIISDMQVTNPNIYQINPESATITPQNELSVTVTFTPNAVKTYNDSLMISSDDPDEPLIYITLSGTGSPVVNTFLPDKNSANMNLESEISAKFNSPMLVNTISNENFKVYGQYSGMHTGVVSYNQETAIAKFSPHNSFIIGEKIQAILTNKIQSESGSIPLIDGTSWKFNTKALLGKAKFHVDDVTYFAGTSPYAISAADFNRDNYTDLVVANSNANSISIFLHDKNFGFFAPAIYSVGKNPRALTIADINSDSYPDIITANNSANNISVLTNKGNGTFNNAVSSIVGTGPVAVEAADIDNDGDIDLVSANSTSNNISILYNNGTGEFSAPIENISVGTMPSSLILEDLDNDDDIDIAVCNKNSNNISIVLNNSRVFTVSSTYVTGSSPNDIFAHDFDGDKDVDLAIANGLSDDVSILYNNGKGIYTQTNTLAAGGQPISIYGNDLDADNDIDLAVANFTSNNIYIYKNNGSGIFSSNDTVAVRPGPIGITALDVSGYLGVLDLAIANLLSGNISILRNQLPWNLLVNISLTTLEEQSGDIAINYIINDSESRDVNLLCEYSTSGGISWSQATTTGEVLQVSPDKYRSTIIWNSKADLPDSYFESTRFRITPYIGETVGHEDRTEIFIIDNYHNQTATISLAEDKPFYKDNVIVRYTITDPTKDTHTLKLYYQVADQKWKRATTVQDSTGYDSTKYSGILNWSSVVDLPTSNIALVRLTAIPYDNWQQGFGDTTDYFFLNDTIEINGLPTIKLDSLITSQEQNGTITINYQLSDKNQDTVKINAEYSTNAITWKQATISENISQIFPENYIGSFSWLSESDLPGADIQNLIFKCTPEDEETGVADALVFHLDNNLPPQIYLHETSEKLSETVQLSAHLSDSESDLLNIQAWYKLADNSTWETPTITSQKTGLQPGAEPISIIWNSTDDIKNYSGNLWFKVQPFDNDQGNVDSIWIFVDNVNLPVISYLSQPQGEQSGNILFTYVLQDNDITEVTMEFNYSKDNILWQAATVTGDLLSSDLTNNIGNINWHTTQDLAGQDIPAALFRIIPSDDNVGAAATTATFHIDNNQPPQLILGVINSPAGAIIQIPIEVEDAEEDTIFLQSEYRYGNTSWQIMNFDDSQFITATDYQKTLNWNSFIELGYGKFDPVILKFTPIDNDSGTSVFSDTLGISNYAGDYTGDLKINYNDLIIFAQAWNDTPQNISKEIGPATGSPPNFKPVPDGKIDFEDLMILVQQWNWFYDDSVQLSQPSDSTSNDSTSLSKNKIYTLSTKKIANPEIEKTLQLNDNYIKFEQSNYNPWSNEFGNEILVSLDTSLNIMGFKIQLSYTPKTVTLSDWNNIFQNNRKGTTFNLKNANDGSATINTILLNKNMDLPYKGSLIKLNLNFKEEAETLIKFDWEINNYSGEVVSQGTKNFQVFGYDSKPKEYSLFQNYPNPFNPATTIRYQLAAPGKVVLEVYNILGQKIDVLINENKEAGYYTQVWDTSNKNMELATGVYLVRLKIYNNKGKTYTKFKKMLLIR